MPRLSRDDLKKEPYRVATNGDIFYAYNPEEDALYYLPTDDLNNEWRLKIHPLPEEAIDWVPSGLYTNFSKTPDCNFAKLYAEKLVELEQVKRELKEAKQTILMSYDGLFQAMYNRVHLPNEEEAAKAKEAEKLLGRPLLDSVRCWLAHEQKRQTQTTEA